LIRFKPGELVDVTGISKGKALPARSSDGTSAGGDATHGSMHHRAPAHWRSSFPSRVWPAAFSGHMGNSRVTAKNLRV